MHTYMYNVGPSGTSVYIFFSIYSKHNVWLRAIKINWVQIVLHFWKKKLCCFPNNYTLESLKKKFAFPNKVNGNKCTNIVFEKNTMDACCYLYDRHVHDESKKSS